MINQPADLKSNTDMAVIVSSHRTTAATMNSIHSLLSENHPCTLFMGQPPSGYHAPIEQATLSHLRLMTEREPYSYRQSLDNKLCCNDNLDWSKLVINLPTARDARPHRAGQAGS
jgi:hypothetical protein